jgi:hypothetical protein
MFGTRELKQEPLLRELLVNMMIGRPKTVLAASPPRIIQETVSVDMSQEESLLLKIDKDTRNAKRYLSSAGTPKSPGNAPENRLKGLSAITRAQCRASCAVMVYEMLGSSEDVDQSQTDIMDSEGNPAFNNDGDHP